MKLKDVYPKIVAPKGVEVFLDRLNSELKKKNILATAILGGSYAKGDYLNNPDIDIFVVFDKSYKGKDISHILHKAISKFKPILVHGSRDYFHIGNFELIPVLSIEYASEAENITDVSPLHVKWVGSNINKSHDDVRLAKLFCKSAGVYGAESHIMGLSGYILEILIINYGGFDNFVKAASLWKPKVFVDAAGHYRNWDDAKLKLNDAKKMSPLIVIDPVQRDRNASASVSMESFCNLILACKRYLSKPSKSFFKFKPLTIAELSKNSKLRKTKLFVIKVVPLEGKDDVVGSKLLKSFNHIKRQLELNEFRILGSGWNFDFFYFELFEDVLPKSRLHYGPLVWVKGNVDAFMSKYRNVFVVEDRLAVLVPRKFVKALDFVNYVMKCDEVKLRVRSAKCLRK